MKSAYDDRIYSERLLGVTSRCPECGDTLRATGYLRHRRRSTVYPWSIEYECPNEGVIFTIHEVNKAELIDSIVREAGKDPRA